MKRLTIILVASLLTASLFFGVFTVFSPKAHASCTFHVVASAPIVETLTGASLGTADIEIDGCGHIEGHAHETLSTFTTDDFTLTLVDRCTGSSVDVEDVLNATDATTLAEALQSHPSCLLGQHPSPGSRLSLSQLANSSRLLLPQQDLIEYALMAGFVAVAAGAICPLNSCVGTGTVNYNATA
jgi:hypothetical protein